MSATVNQVRIMNSLALDSEFELLSADHKLAIAALALTSEPMSNTKWAACMRHINSALGKGKAQTVTPQTDQLVVLQRKGFIIATTNATFSCAEGVIASAIRAAFKMGAFDAVCVGVEATDPLQKAWGGNVYVRNYRQAISLLRMRMLRGRPPDQIRPWLAVCDSAVEAQRRHPYVEICGSPFDAELVARLHPQVREEVMAALLRLAINNIDSVAALRVWLDSNPLAHAIPSETRVVAMAEFHIFCGRLGDAWELVKSAAGGTAQALRGAVLLLRGETVAGLQEFETGLKQMRSQTKNTRACFGGIGGFVYALALLRADEPSAFKRFDAYLDNVARGPLMHEVPFRYLRLLRVARSGGLRSDVEMHKSNETNPLTFMFQMLTYYWLGTTQFGAKRDALAATYEATQAAGFQWVAAQLAELLGRLGETKYSDIASALRVEHGFTNVAEWLERQESWQRQLAALQNLAPSSALAAGAEPESRLAWMISYDPHLGFSCNEPREQKRDARGGWNKGRAVALKRLAGEECPAFLSAHDRRVAASVRRDGSLYSHSRYELDDDAALLALIGHPLVFWFDAPTVRVELLAAEPQLLVQSREVDLVLSIQPPISNELGNVVITKETPTRLRITKIADEHRRIAAIVGDGLSVPKHAKQQVLDAIAAISSLVTVHSDVEGGAANVPQVEGDARLHVHLLPHDAGIKLQILVRPFTDTGPYFSPGSGAERVIAEVAGKPCQARRELTAESAAATQLIAACSAFEAASQLHGEWLVDDPSSSLELLLQLQALGDRVVLAWPEGEKFKVKRQLDSKQFSISIKRENSLFAATGQLRIAEDKVLDLRKLLQLMQHSPGRFIAIGGNEFVALTEEFRRRLDELAAYSDAHGAGVRVHPMAAFALEELAADAGEMDADRHWKQHVKRLRELDKLEPQLPSTLQAELREYQVEGFCWLSRLAHWGVGACLADDMGLGKTVQALALILARAAQGPTLVIAPTSVCMNWMAEAARFAPTLNVILFGAGDRQQILSTLKPFDLVVSSYGLLQQEAELFASVQWHTIVLDEAQAIKNRETKRAQAALALRGDFKIVATGTPLENHLGELWSLFHFVNPGLLGSLEYFNQRYAGPIERRQDAGVRARLRKLIQPFILRRTKSQVLTELPSRTEILRQVDLSAEEMTLYEALRREALDRLAALDAPPGQKQIQILAEIMKLRRACCHPQLVAPQLKLSGSKLAAFGELLDELLENRHKALVFSQFVDHLSLIRAYLDERGVRYQYLDGATPMQQRKTRVDAFQAGEGDVFLISLKAGGTGLNLTAADYVIHMDPWWNPAVEDQASDRAHRMGQQRPVTIYRLVARHTIEEKIVELHQHKRDLADSLLGGGDVSGKMSADAILKLLQEEFRD